MWGDIGEDFKAGLLQMDAAENAAAAAENLKALADIAGYVEAEQLILEYRKRSEFYLGTLLLSEEEA